MSHHNRHIKKGKKYFKKLAKRYAPELRDLLMLWFVSKKPAHGYELIKRFDSLGQEALKAKANRIYPGLEKMKEKGYVKSELDTTQSQKKPRKVYTLTPEGKEHLLNEIDELRASLDSLKLYLDEIDADIR
ncbi:MAG TPA: PadR family transcriptional regulator [Actinobacteria bacterium]|nr:PadR family transcriptional regulator [Actinomycetes bacterium]HEX21114.1 PadR family transcriptional regulator [Actinomycetota bacterium]